MTEGQADRQYINKYSFADGQTEGCWYSGSTFIGDGKQELDLNDDAAYILWGSEWQMPSQEQLYELINSSYTTSVWTTQNGVYGRKVTSKKNGNSIFLPAAGWRSASTLAGEGTTGYYWSNSLGGLSVDYAFPLNFSSNYWGVEHHDRFCGQSIRPVRRAHEYVDLNLPSGTLWATCNVGADSPEEYGDYFAWGETEPKVRYTWENYEWCEGTAETLTKYCCQSQYGYNGFTDDLTELVPEDDAATANWGIQWQMPSGKQLKELMNEAYTTSEWTTLNGVNGCKITSRSNGKSIFLPMAGYIGVSLTYGGSHAYYLSRSLTLIYSGGAEYLYLKFEDSSMSGGTNRDSGQSVRPVRKK